MLSRVRFENFLGFLVQDIEIEIVCRAKRGKILKKFCLIYVSKGVIWASEYSLGPQLWGSKGGPRPPGSPLDPPLHMCTFFAGEPRMDVTCTNLN